jgi:hypothetical protein
MGAAAIRSLDPGFPRNDEIEIELRVVSKQRGGLIFQ